MTTAAVRAFQWDSALRHAPISVEVSEGGFQCPCRCGFPGRRVASSPSHSYQVTRTHAENENQREAAGGAIVKAEDYTRNGEPPRTARRAVPPSRPSVGSPVAPKTLGGSPCGCGCGEPSGGLFRPGHDSKLLSRLTAGIKSGAITLAEAHEEMTLIGTSEVLKEKLAKKVASNAVPS